MFVSLTHDGTAFGLPFGRQCASITTTRHGNTGAPWDNTVESQVRLGWESMTEAEPRSLRWGGN